MHDGEHLVLAMGQVVAAIKSRMNLNETWSPHIVWLQKPLKAWSVRDCHAASGSGKRAESGVSSATSELAQMPQREASRTLTFRLLHFQSPSPRRTLSDSSSPSCRVSDSLCRYGRHYLETLHSAESGLTPPVAVAIINLRGGAVW